MNAATRSRQRPPVTVAASNVGTFADVTGHPVALESGADRGQIYHPEHVAVFAFLALHVDQPADTHLLVDTALQMV